MEKVNRLPLLCWWKSKWIRALIFVAIYVTVGFWFHWFDLPSDREFRDSFKEKLLANKLTNVNEFIGEGEMICFSGFYATPESLQEPISDYQRSYLMRRIVGFFGGNDHTWWVYILKGDDGITMYRMGRSVHPHFRGSRCISYLNGLSYLKVVEVDDYTIFF